MSQILVDIQAKTICVDDYILFHAATDFIIQNATARNFILTISTHQGIILFRVGNFVDDGVNLTARVNLISDGLVDAFRHVPHNGCRKFLLNIHDRNASFAIQFSDELIIWNDITHTSDMNEYALKTEIPDVSGFITIDSLTPYVKKTDLPDFRTYALKSELFSRKYNDLNGKPDLSVYALKTDVPDVSGFVTSDDLPDFGIYALKSELPNLENYALKTELFSKKYSDLTGAPDLNLYALKTEIPDGVDLSGYLTITAAAETYAGKSHTHSEYALKTEIPDVSELQGADGTTFTPSLDAEGNLSWTNDGGLENPTPVNIKGNKGDTGETGAAAVSFAVFTAVTDETAFAGTAQLINADGTAGETVDVVFDFAVLATGE